MTQKDIKKLSKAEWQLVVYLLQHGKPLAQIKLARVRKEAQWN